jgi:NTP pyrophosphatase (non-canonical NTP hydrolase)
MSDDLKTLIGEIRKFVADREWAQFHDPKNLSMAVASEAGELLAEYRWVENEQADAVSRDPAARERIAAEIADVGISLLMLADRIGLDLIAAMRAKLEKNALKYPVESSRGRSERP